MDGRRNVDVDPDTRPVKAQMGTDEEASAGALSVLSILGGWGGGGGKKQTNCQNDPSEMTCSFDGAGIVAYSHRVLHVGDGRGELAEVQLGAVDKRVSEIAAATAGAHASDLPLLAIGHHGGVVLASGDALDSREREGHCRCVSSFG